VAAFSVRPASSLIWRGGGGAFLFHLIVPRLNVKTKCKCWQIWVWSRSGATRKDWNWEVFASWELQSAWFLNATKYLPNRAPGYRLIKLQIFVIILNGAAGSVRLEESRPWSLVPNSLRLIFTDEISLDQTNPLVNKNLLQKVNLIVVPSWTYAEPLFGCRGADNSHLFFICLSIYLFIYLFIYFARFADLPPSVYRLC